MTAGSNGFQGQNLAAPPQQQRAALTEFDELVEVMRGVGINAIVVDDSEEPHTPDAIFPNNWVSFHADGRVLLYPMQAPNRRSERRLDIIDALRKDHGFHITEVLDLSAHENAGHYLEGTGSMVLDRANRIAYACLSSRTQLDPLGDFAQRMDYDIVAFDASDREGMPIYHTNVLMNIGEAVAVICDAAIAGNQREAVLSRLRESGHDIVSLNFDQLHAFAGNMLELKNKAGERVLAMSSQAWQSLNESQQALLEKNAIIAHSPIDNIEAAAGGSVRCMLAEIHLPS